MVATSAKHACIPERLINKIHATLYWIILRYYLLQTLVIQDRFIKFTAFLLAWGGARDVVSTSVSPPSGLSFSPSKTCKTTNKNLLMAIMEKRYGTKRGK